MRTLDELLSDEDAWPSVSAWAAAARNRTEILAVDESARATALVETQVTTRSPMGAVVYHSGGILVDHGWIRILGSGHARLPRSLPGWNRLVASEGMYLVADDVVGGFFALDGGGLGPGRGDAYYFAPDRLEWEPLDRGYTDLLRWCFDGDLARYYEGLRWPGWEAEVAALAGDRAYSFYPPQFMKEFREGTPRRRDVPIVEIYGLSVDDGE